MLSYKMQFVLNEFAHVWANVSVRAQLRSVKLRQDVRWVRCVKRIFSLRCFQVMRGPSGCNPIVSQGTTVVLLLSYLTFWKRGWQFSALIEIISMMYIFNSFSNGHVTNHIVDNSILQICLMWIN